MESPGLRHSDLISGQGMHVGIFKYDANKKAVWYGFDVSKPLEKILDGIIGEKEFNLTGFNFTEHAIQYDNWFFTRERIEKKIKSHCEWKCYNFNSIEEALIKKCAIKIQTYRCYNFKKEDHPREIIDIIDNYLNKDHLGYNFFDLVKFK